MGNILSLKSVVNEFYFEEGINPIAEFFKTVFAQRGKLRPLRKHQAKVKAEKTEKADILIHVVKGKDIPARAKAAGQVKAFREKALGAGGFQSAFSPRGFSGYPGVGYPGTTGQMPGFYPPSSTELRGLPEQPGRGTQNFPGYEGYPGGVRSLQGSPGREFNAHDMIPGYPLGYSQRFGSAGDFNNDINNPYRNQYPQYPQDPNTLRQAMSGHFDTRMAVQGEMRTFLFMFFVVIHI